MGKQLFMATGTSEDLKKRKIIKKLSLPELWKFFAANDSL